MTLLEQALDAVRRRRPDAEGRGLELIGVFGSLARGDEGPQSDVDVAYDVIGKASLLDVAHIMIELQDDLGRPVDMTDISQVKAVIREHIERDLIRI